MKIAFGYLILVLSGLAGGALLAGRHLLSAGTASTMQAQAFDRWQKAAAAADGQVDFKTREELLPLMAQSDGPRAWKMLTQTGVKPRTADMEQIARDARISTLYEGTTGIQALDLLGRKVLLQSKGKAVRDFTAEVLKFCGRHARDKKMRRYVWDLTKVSAQWNYLTTRIMLTARKDRDIVSSACNDFLMYSGYVTMGYFWALQEIGRAHV